MQLYSEHLVILSIFCYLKNVDYEIVKQVLSIYKKAMSTYYVGLILFVLHSTYIQKCSLGEQ